MKTQKVLLFSFLLLLLLGTVPVTLVSFYTSQLALKAEISRNLKNDAVMLMQQIDMMMFERLQNIHSWSHLEIMQEGRIGDVDKQLSQFLLEINNNYPGIYQSLFYVDTDDRIVAATNPAMIGSIFRSEPDWMEISVPQGEVFLTKLNDPSILTVHAPVPNNYGTGIIGQLYAVLNQRQIWQWFDQASYTESGDRFIVLLDAAGNVIAASAVVRDKGYLLTQEFADMRPDNNSDSMTVRNGEPLIHTQLLVGSATSSGYQGYADSGWSLLVMQSTQQAFQPIIALWWLFATVFFITVAIAGLISQRIAGHITRPLLDLTEWVRRFQHSAPSKLPVMEKGTLEVRELGAAFDQLTTDLEHSRQQIIHAAKLAVVGEMAAIMAHEVRTPLGIIQTTSQMLQREAGLNDESKDMASMIAEESIRLNRLISALLDCARPRPPDMRQHDLLQIICRVIELLSSQAQKKAIRIDWQTDSKDVTVECDEELLIQVFLNLILNAIQLLDQGGHIRIEVDNVDNETISIAVEDNGRGIPVENQARLFDPFFTTRKGGVGLGLTVTQQIISLHGGKISAGTSALGGAGFTIYLPRRQGSK